MARALSKYGQVQATRDRLTDIGFPQRRAMASLRKEEVIMNALAELLTDGPSEVPRDLRHGPAPTDLGAGLSFEPTTWPTRKATVIRNPPGRIRNWTFGTSCAQQVPQPSL